MVKSGRPRRVVCGQTESNGEWLWWLNGWVKGQCQSGQWVIVVVKWMSKGWSMVVVVEWQWYVVMVGKG